MKLSRCPVCHQHIHLEALAQDEAGKELMGIIAKQTPAMASSCLSYIGLYRPFKSDLNNGRALRLLHEVLAITPNIQALCAAMDQTVMQISTSRQTNNDVKPLTNHNYLIKVLSSMPGWQEQKAVKTLCSTSTAPIAASKQGQALAALDELMEADDE